MLIVITLWLYLCCCLSVLGMVGTRGPKGRLVILTLIAPLTIMYAAFGPTPPRSKTWAEKIGKG